MRGSVVGSGVIHLMLLVALFYARTPNSLVIPGPEAVQVALMDPSALMQAAPPEPEAPKPTPHLDEIKPVEDTGVKLQPPPKAKPKPEPKHDEPPPAMPAPALPSAPAGASGLRGDVAIDGQNFEFTYYLVLVRNKIASNWTPPAGLATGGRTVRAVIYFRIGRGGDLSAARIETVSGVEFFDRSALRAVMLSDPLPPLPLGFSGGDLGVHFGFDWETP